MQVTHLDACDTSLQSIGEKDGFEPTRREATQRNDFAALRNSGLA